MFPNVTCMLIYDLFLQLTIWEAADSKRQKVFCFAPLISIVSQNTAKGPLKLAPTKKTTKNDC